MIKAKDLKEGGVYYNYKKDRLEVCAGVRMKKKRISVSTWYLEFEVNREFKDPNISRFEYCPHNLRHVLPEKVFEYCYIGEP